MDSLGGGGYRRHAFDDNSKDVLLLGTAVPTEGDSSNADRINARWPLGILHPATYCAADRLFKGRTENDSLGRPLHWFAERLEDQAHETPTTGDDTFFGAVQ